MLCEWCQREGKASTIRFSGKTLTSLPSDYYYDEQGRYHYHNPNESETTFECSNGHVWVEIETEKCETCEKSRPPERFQKYEKSGDYHWRQYDQGAKYKTHADRVALWVREKHVLDIGAGDGKITSLIGAVGIDNEPEGVRLAQEHGVNVILGDAYHLPYADGEFESVLMADVLEHFEFPEKALAEARRVLTKYIYITTPPKRPDGKLTDRYHWIEWSPEELKALVESCGFTLEGEILSLQVEKVMYGKFKHT